MTIAQKTVGTGAATKNPSRRLRARTGLVTFSTELLYDQRRRRLFNVLLLITGIGNAALLVGSQLDVIGKLVVGQLDLAAFWGQLDLEILSSQLAGLVAIAICALLNRRYTTVAATLFFLTINAILGYYINTLDDSTFLSDLRGTSILLLVPIVAAGVIIRPVFSFVFAILSATLVTAIGISHAHPGLYALETPQDALAQLAVLICMMFVMAGLSWIFETTIHNLITQMSEQNKRLDRANRELAYRAEVEQQLSRRVDELTGQLSEAFQQQNRSSVDQIAAVLRVSSAVEELNQANDSILGAADEVDGTAQRTLEVVETGTATVRDGLSALVALNDQALQVADSLKVLYQQARQIDQIIELINEITDETNLLALNATIEAAGAGEYGRRFASVAQEVQRLANRSRDATEQIQDMVNEIRDAVENSTTLSQRGIRETGGVLSGVRQMEQALEGIVAMSQNTASLARQISVSIQQQRGATIEVVETMREISSISQAVAEGNEYLLNNLTVLNNAVAQLNAVSLTD